MKNLLAILIGVALLAVLFVWFKPAPATVVPAVPTPPPAAASDTPVAVAPAAPAEAEASPAEAFELVVTNQQRSHGPAVISVTEGARVKLTITSDRADELHLHGYDLTLELPAGVPATLEFVADRSGRFEYELHKAHVDLGALEVQPR